MDLAALFGKTRNDLLLNPNPNGMFYEIVIHLYTTAIRVAAWFHPKARLWTEGRHQWRKRYAQAFQKKARVLWVHAASLGEFEQGRPLIEAFKQQHPDWQVVLTFFSPSGYEIRKNYPHADWVGYLPTDTRRNARDFVAWLQPDLVFFVKYEFWANHLMELRKHKVPTYLVSGLFRSNQPFFKPWGGFWRDILKCFTHLFIQNEPSQHLLQSIGFTNTTVCGDTRVDRVLQIAQQAPTNERVAIFAQDAQVLVAGSTWPPDEALLLALMASPPSGVSGLKYIIAPHDPSENHITALEAQLTLPSLRYSQATPDNIAQVTVLLIDNVGMLNTLYRYGQFAYIGGGFGKGIHNTLEPAAFGLPIVFGPRYHKFEEARVFVASSGAITVRDAADLCAALEKWGKIEERKLASEAVLAYLNSRKGATPTILATVAHRI